MYDKIKSDISQDFYQQHFSNDGQRFVAWYVHHIHGRNFFETKEDVTDGADDKQIDALVVNDDETTVYVIQGKFIGSESVSAEPLREVLASWISLKDIVSLQENANQQLQSRLSEVATAIEEDYSIAFELITTGQLSQPASDDLARFQQALADDDQFPAEIHVVDSEELLRRFEAALERDNPAINHRVTLEAGKYMELQIGGTKCVVAAVSLKECIKFPGIKDGTLFQKNVRQSLGLSNSVNKGIKASIYGNATQDFFFHHNGITAICNHLTVDDGVLALRGLNVVNGCQSLNTIHSCSEKVKELDNSYVMIRFYEIPQRERGDRISISTNSQTSVKPRDLRSNDRRVLALKRAYEDIYPNGYFITKRGEVAPADKHADLTVDLLALGKLMIAWHSQRPNISHSETKIFTQHFDQLFVNNGHYPAESAHALNQWMHVIRRRWNQDNPLALNESLLAMQAYAPYHHLYAVSQCFCAANRVGQGVPDPVVAWNTASSANLVDQVVNMAGTCLNSALEAAANETQPANRVFSPQNWIKTIGCLSGIRLGINSYFNMLPSMPNGGELFQTIRDGLKMDHEHFADRWAAD